MIHYTILQSTRASITRVGSNTFDSVEAAVRYAQSLLDTNHALEMIRLQEDTKPDDPNEYLDVTRENLLSYMLSFYPYDGSPPLPKPEEAFAAKHDTEAIKKCEEMVSEARSHGLAGRASLKEVEFDSLHPFLAKTLRQIKSWSIEESEEKKAARKAALAQEAKDTLEAMELE